MVGAENVPVSINHVNRLIGWEKLETEDKPPTVLIQFCRRLRRALQIVPKEICMPALTSQSTGLEWRHVTV
jgi:hypothetical protein